MRNPEDEADTTRPTVAQRAWEDLRKQGKLKDPTVFALGPAGLFPQLYFCYEQDGSILTFSEKKEQWMFFIDAASLSWAKTIGNC